MNKTLLLLLSLSLLFFPKANFAQAPNLGVASRVAFTASGAFDNPGATNITHHTAAGTTSGNNQMPGPHAHNTGAHSILSDVLSVIIDGTPGNNPVISLSDISGKIVKEILLAGNKAEVNITDLLPGIYLLKYMDESRSETIEINKQ